jgi:hypothetical protein
MNFIKNEIRIFRDMRFLLEIGYYEDFIFVRNFK